MHILKYLYIRPILFCFKPIYMNTKVVFGWTDLRRFTVQEDGFEWMKVVWLTWFGRMDH